MTSIHDFGRNWKVVRVPNDDQQGVWYPDMDTTFEIVVDDAGSATVNEVDGAYPGTPISLRYLSHTHSLVGTVDINAGEGQANKFYIVFTMSNLKGGALECDMVGIDRPNEVAGYTGIPN